LFPSLSFAQNTKSFTLKDGSIIKGELISFQDQMYSIRLPGQSQTMDVPESYVIQISDANTANSANTSSTIAPSTIPSAAQIQNMQNMLLADPAAMEQIQSLLQDPEITSILSDPDFMNAVMTYDTQKVSENEKTQKLLENPKILRLIESFQGKLSDTSSQ
jgi:hypothetical protein